MSRTYLSAVVILMVGLAASAGRAADSELQAKVNRVHKNIVANASTITKLAYVQSTGHTGTDVVKAEATVGGGFELTYKFSYRDESRKSQTFTTRFVFDANGKLTKLVPVSNTDWWPQFGTAALIGAAVEELAKEFNK